MKKLLSVVLCAVLIAGAFCACSSNNQEKYETSLKFTYDSVYNDFDESVIRAYKSVCEAIINHEDEVRINVGMRENIQQLLYTSFPLIDLVDNIKEKDDKSGLLLSYKNEDSVHIQKVQQFEQIISDIQEKCLINEVSKTEYILRVYNYISSNISVSDDMTVSVYQTIVNSKGTSFTYSKFFEYLLQQADIESYHILAEDASKTGWGLSSAIIDSKLYYFDVMSEYYANKGTQLIYFGMTSDEVKNEGLSNLLYNNQASAKNADELDFDACRQCVSWEITDSKLLITRADNKIVEIDIA